ncbi:MAG: hypothetical protein R3332_01360 [Pseudohongiellaceae bacterium]|nr:hypothetical protein [Pseudohongiellaceae bacterium]
MKRSVTKILKSPYLSLTAAIVLLATAGFEVYEGLEEFHIGSEHGLFTFALFQILKVVPDIAEAADDLEESFERRKEKV